MKSTSGTRQSYVKIITAALLALTLLMTVTPVNASEVIMRKGHDPQQDVFAHGDIIKFTVEITVRNTAGGPTIPIHDLKIIDTLPDGLTYQTGSETHTPAATFTQVGQVLTWDFGHGPFNSDPHAKIEFEVKVDDTVPQGKTLRNNAEAEYREGLQDPLSNPNVHDDVTIQFPILDIDKTAAPPVIHEGDSFTYTVTLSNTGGEDALNVKVEDPIPATVTYTSGATASSGTLDTSNPLKLVWTGTIPQAGTVTLTIPVKDKAGGPSTLTNSAKYTQYPDNAEMTKLEDDASVQVIHPVIQLVKTCTPSSGIEPLDVVYSYKVTNTGDVPLTAVKVHDDTLGVDIVLPTPLTLAVGESKSGQLFRNDLMQGTYVNHATAEGVDPLGLKVTAEDDATCTVIKEPIKVGGEVYAPTPDATDLIRQGLGVALAAVGVALLLKKR